MQVHPQLGGDGKPHQGVRLQEVHDVHRKHEKLLLPAEPDRGPRVQRRAGHHQERNLIRIAHPDRRDQHQERNHLPQRGEPPSGDHGRCHPAAAPPGAGATRGKAEKAQEQQAEVSERTDDDGDRRDWKSGGAADRNDAGASPGAGASIEPAHPAAERQRDGFDAHGEALGGSRRALPAPHHHRQQPASPADSNAFE